MIDGSGMMQTIFLKAKATRGEWRAILTLGQATEWKHVVLILRKYTSNLITTKKRRTVIAIIL